MNFSARNFIGSSSKKIDSEGSSLVQNMETPDLHGVGAALENLGNTCFMNSVLQCLTHTVPFVEVIRSLDHPYPCCISCRNDGFCFVCLVKKHIDDCFEYSGKLAIPVDLAANMGQFLSDYKAGSQEDAHEFLRQFLDKLDGCNVVGPSSRNCFSDEETSFVKEVFGGRIRNQTRYPECGHCSNKFESILDASMGIDGAHCVNSVLDYFTGVEKIEDFDKKYTCGECQAQMPVIETQIKFDKAPKVLALHLKRFHYNGFFITKISNHVVYPLELDIKPYLLECHNNEDLTYDLCSIVVHSGASLDSGHYYSYVRSSPTTWHCMDDDKVTRVSQEDALDHSAYILFYIRKGVSPWFSSLMKDYKIAEKTENATSPTSMKAHRIREETEKDTPASMKNHMITKTGISPTSVLNSIYPYHTLFGETLQIPRTSASPSFIPGKKRDRAGYRPSPSITSYESSDHLNGILEHHASIRHDGVSESMQAVGQASAPQNNIRISVDGFKHDLSEDEGDGDDGPTSPQLSIAKCGNEDNKQAAKPTNASSVNNLQKTECFRQMTNMPSSRRRSLILCLPGHTDTNARRRRIF